MSKPKKGKPVIDLNDVKPLGADLAPASTETEGPALVLSPITHEDPEEVIDTYRHHKDCGGRTTIPAGIKHSAMFNTETAYCAACNQRRPVTDFSWAKTGAKLIAVLLMLICGANVSAGSLYDAASKAGDRETLAQPLVTVEAIADDTARDLFWMIGTHAGDLLTTAIALERCNGTCGELNPVGQTPEARIALKMAGAAGTGLVLWKLRRSGHASAATVMRWAVVAVNAALIINNTTHAVRRR